MSQLFTDTGQRHGARTISFSVPSSFDQLTLQELQLVEMKLSKLRRIKINHFRAWSENAGLTFKNNSLRKVSRRAD